MRTPIILAALALGALCGDAAAQQWIKQSTETTIKLCPFVDSTDGVTPEDSLTITKADVRLAKNGGNYAAANADQGTSDAGAPYDEAGEYDVALDATDTDTLGRLRIMVQESGALPVWQEFLVVPAEQYDRVVAGVERTPDGRGRLIYVAASGGNDANSGVKDAPLATLGQANTNANEGDHIILLAGTHTGDVDWTVDNVTISGLGPGNTIISAATPAGGDTGDTFSINSTKGVTVRDLTVEATTSGQALGATSTIDAHLVNLHLNGDYDGLAGDSSQGLRVYNCRVSGNWDAANFGSAKRFELRNCSFSTDSSYGTSQANTALMAASASGRAVNCDFIATRSTSGTLPLSGLYVGGTSTTSLELINCNVSASDTGNNDDVPTIGIYNNGGEVNLYMQGGAIVTSNNGDAEEQDVYLIAASFTSSVLLHGVAHDPAKLVNDHNPIVGVATLRSLDGDVASVLVDTSTALPEATAGSNGGLPTVDGNNRVAGIQGTITTLDGLDTAQDSQHTATQNALSTIDSNVDSILEDTGTTLPGTLSGLATSAALTSVGNNVTAILEDTGTTLPGTLSTIGGNVTSILEDTGTTLPGTLSTIDGNVDAILEDTGTTLPGTLAGLATQTSVNTIDGIVDNIYTAFELDGSVYRLTTNALEQGGAVSLDPEDIDNIADATALAVGEGLGEAVWTYDGDRLLTAGTNIVLAKGTGITGFNDLDASGMRSALGMSAANLDTQLGNIPTTAEFEARTIAAADYLTASDITGLGTAITQIDAIATNGVTIAEDGLTAESIADGVTIGGGVTLEELQQELANIDIDLGPVSEQLDDIESAIGAISADITPPLQLDIDKDFTFDMPNRTSGVVSALNDIYLSSDSETPHFAFDVSKIDRNKPATIVSVEVLDEGGAATNDLVVADQEDTTNCGVKDYLVISKVTNCVESGTYKVKVTYQVAGGRTYVVTGNIIVP